MNALIQRTKKLNNKKGFTLIELIVVIVIIGILAAIVVPRLSGFTDTAKKQAVVADAKTIASAAAALYAETGTTPVADDIKDYADYDGTVNWTGTGGVISFTYTLDGYSVTVTDGKVGTPTKVGATEE